MWSTGGIPKPGSDERWHGIEGRIAQKKIDALSTQGGGEGGGRTEHLKRLRDTSIEREKMEAHARKSRHETNERIQKKKSDFAKKTGLENSARTAAAEKRDGVAREANRATKSNARLSELNEGARNARHKSNMASIPSATKNRIKSRTGAWIAGAAGAAGLVGLAGYALSKQSSNTEKRAEMSYEKIAAAVSHRESLGFQDSQSVQGNAMREGNAFFASDEYIGGQQRAGIYGLAGGGIGALLGAGVGAAVGGSTGAGFGAAGAGLLGLIAGDVYGSKKIHDEYMDERGIDGGFLYANADKAAIKKYLPNHR